MVDPFLLSPHFFYIWSLLYLQCCAVMLKQRHLKDHSSLINLPDYQEGLSLYPTAIGCAAGKHHMLFSLGLEPLPLESGTLDHFRWGIWPKPSCTNCTIQSSDYGAETAARA